MRQSIVTALNKQKVPNTLNIIATQYASSDIVCLQEVSAAFIGEANKNSVIAANFHVIPPAELDGKRDQNSVILLSKAKFPNSHTAEITHEVEANFPPGVDVPIAKGDILAVTATAASGEKYVVASFHGDTNGLATIPVLRAMDKTLRESAALTGHKLIFGLDANT